jgi:hypothetical protein
MTHLVADLYDDSRPGFQETPESIRCLWERINTFGSGLLGFSLTFNTIELNGERGDVERAVV